jgi:hypothetical protein
MIPKVSPSSVASEFNEFLYAPIGEDKNGLLITVLSAFARKNLDPWQEAADLDRLPADTAAQKLTSIIASLPSQQPMLDDPAPIAIRLITLLPGRAASIDKRIDPRQTALPAFIQAVPKALWIGYGALLLLSLSLSLCT